MKSMKKMILVFCAWCFVTSLHAQTAEHANCDGDISPYQKQYSISFGETINTGVSTQDKLMFGWSVSPTNGVSKSSGTGNETGEILFSQPGSYQISYSIPAHGDHASKVEVIEVKVSEVSMKVDKSNITFSRNLTSGSVDGITMKVPVDVKIYGKKTYEYTANDLLSTGASRVAYTLKGKKAILKNDINYLEFELSGTIAQPGTIQFRIENPAGEASFFNKIVE